MSESSTVHADVVWPHPASEAARLDGRYTPERNAAGVRLAEKSGPESGPIRD